MMMMTMMMMDDNPLMILNRDMNATLKRMMPTKTIRIVLKGMRDGFEDASGR
jgi:hypothetical protein